MNNICHMIDIGFRQDLMKQAIRIALAREGKSDAYVSLPYRKLKVSKWHPTYRKLLKENGM